jgi:hypothetical protein
MKSVAPLLKINHYFCSDAQPVYVSQQRARAGVRSGFIPRQRDDKPQHLTGVSSVLLLATKRYAAEFLTTTGFDQDATILR